jgi:CubicO group peptidase (beta-lactamase class C family)
MLTRAPGATRHVSAVMTAALATALCHSVGAAQSSQLPSKEVVVARVDSLALAYLAEKGPASMSVAISRGSEMLVQRAWGVADIVTKRPASAATVYKIGSVSKQFTAALLLKQVERGRLALTDSIGRYLTVGLRPEWRSLTIEQLLNHTAGLPNDLKREGRPEEEVSVDTMIAWAARDTMVFAPGTRFSYSNVGYLLLGALVEKLYAKPYGAAVREEIVRPLGLRTLGWCTEPGKDTLVATGHQYLGPGKLERAPYAHPSKSVGGGGLCASAGDLAAWNRALHGGRVLSPASYAAMTTPRGAARGYGFGLYLTTTAWGARGIYHLGGIIGFSAQNVWFPAESLSVTILYNSIGDGFSTNFILEVARAISATAPQAEQPRTPPSGELDSTAPANLTRERTIGAVVGIVKGADATKPVFWLAGTHHSSPQQAARRRFAPPAGRFMASPTPACDVARHCERVES